MKPSKILLVSIFITAVMIAVAGGVTRMAVASNVKSSEVNAEQIKAYQQREAEYNQLIQQANQQLDEANKKLQMVQQNQASPAQPSSGSALAAISPDQAQQIAQKAAELGQSIQKKPELVSFKGKPAYEVAFQKGSIYIDSQSGEVLFNGTVPQTITADKAAQIAADYLKEQDILQVDQITFRNAPLYRVIFKSGMMVFLDTTGQITYMLKSGPKRTIIQVDNSGSGGGMVSSGGPGYYEDGEHEGQGGLDN